MISRKRLGYAVLLAALAAFPTIADCADQGYGENDPDPIEKEDCGEEAPGPLTPPGTPFVITGDGCDPPSRGYAGGGFEGPSFTSDCIFIDQTPASDDDDPLQDASALLECHRAELMASNSNLLVTVNTTDRVGLDIDHVDPDFVFPSFCWAEFDRDIWTVSVGLPGQSMFAKIRKTDGLYDGFDKNGNPGNITMRVNNSLPIVVHTWGVHSDPLNLRLKNALERAGFDTYEHEDYIVVSWDTNEQRMIDYVEFTSNDAQVLTSEVGLEQFDAGNWSQCSP